MPIPEHLNAMMPSTFLQVSAGFLVIVASLFGAASLWPHLRQIALRIAAVSMLSAVAILADNITTYIIAVFVIATAITEHEFLSTLAAILKGDKNYFDYKKEALSVEEAQKKVTEEQRENTEADEIKPAQEETPSFKRNTELPSTNSLAFNIENRALAWYESKQGVPVQKYVRLRKANEWIELDGLVEDKAAIRDTIIEIKWFRSIRKYHFDSVAKQVALMARLYPAITGRQCKVVVLIVTTKNEPFHYQWITEFKETLSESSIDPSVQLLTLSELGIDS